MRVPVVGTGILYSVQISQGFCSEVSSTLAEGLSELGGSGAGRDQPVPAQLCVEPRQGLAPPSRSSPSA